MHNSDQITEINILTKLQIVDAPLTLIELIVHSTSAAIDNSFHHDLKVLVVFLTDWDLALWQSGAQ